MRRLQLIASAALLGAAINAQADNSATIAQTGDDNSATVEQTGQLNEAVIRQNGTANVGSVYQHDVAESNLTNLVQVGSDNNVVVYQGPDSHFSSARIYQEGAGNSIDVEQTWYANDLQTSSAGDNNRISAIQQGFAGGQAYQIGNNNSIILDQYGIYHGTTLAVYQVGDDNRASVEQGDAGNIKLAQNGNLNTATISQNTCLVKSSSIRQATITCWSSSRAGAAMRSAARQPATATA